MCCNFDVIKPWLYQSHPEGIDYKKKSIWRKEKNFRKFSIPKILNLTSMHFFCSLVYLCHQHKQLFLPLIYWQQYLNKFKKRYQFNAITHPSIHQSNNDIQSLRFVWVPSQWENNNIIWQKCISYNKGKHFSLYNFSLISIP